MKIIMLFCIFFLSSAVFSFAQTTNETLTVSTYYPAPYGVYRNLRLSPTTQPTTGLGAGLMYYNASEGGTIKYRNNTGVWHNLSTAYGGGCQLVSFFAATVTPCPVNYYTWSAVASAPNGEMLCCKCENRPF